MDLRNMLTTAIISECLNGEAMPFLHARKAKVKEKEKQILEKTTKRAMVKIKINNTMAHLNFLLACRVAPLHVMDCQINLAGLRPITLLVMLRVNSHYQHLQYHKLLRRSQLQKQLNALHSLGT